VSVAFEFRHVQDLHLCHIVVATAAVLAAVVVAAAAADGAHT